MGKKSRKKKLKKKLKKMLVERLAEEQLRFQEQPTTISKEVITEEKQIKSMEKPRILAPQKSRLSQTITPYLKRDLTRIGITLLSMFALLFIIKLISIKTDVVFKLSDFLSKFLHIF